LCALSTALNHLPPDWQCTRGQPRQSRLRSTEFNLQQHNLGLILGGSRCRIVQNSIYSWRRPCPVNSMPGDDDGDGTDSCRHTQEIYETDRLFLFGWKSFGVGSLRLGTLCSGSHSVGFRNGRRSWMSSRRRFTHNCFVSSDDAWKQSHTHTPAYRNICCVQLKERLPSALKTSTTSFHVTSACLYSMSNPSASGPINRPIAPMGSWGIILNHGYYTDLLPSLECYQQPTE